MMGLFKNKPPSPVELVQQARDLFIYADRNTETRERKREEKMDELNKLISDIRTVLYGSSQSEPSSEACAQLTQEFFREDTFRLLIVCLPKLNLGARQDATHMIANLQRQRVNSRSIASEYLENNLDILDILIHGYEDTDIALTYGAFSRECMRHQSVVRYLLNSELVKECFNYIQSPDFDTASDAQATFKELLTRHKSTVADFLSTNYDWFFSEYNSKLLQSSNYVTRRHAVQLLGNMLLDRSNSAVMVRYVSSLDNMRILMNLLRDSNKGIQLEAFHVFKLFVANQNKPPEVINVLVSNRSKILRFLGDFKFDKEDEQFEADKLVLIKEIATLQLKDHSHTHLDDCEAGGPC